MEKLKKILTSISLTCIAVAAIMLIAAVFGLNVFDGILLKILLSVATIAVASGLSINEISVIRRNKILGLIGLALLGVSSLFALIIFWVGIEFVSTFTKITIIISISSIVFIVIISQYTKLLKHAFALQICAYVGLILIDIIVSVSIGGYNLFALPSFITWFVILCIVTVAMQIALAVLSSRHKGAEDYLALKNKDMVMVPKAEYEALKLENQNLKEEIEKLKTTNEVNTEV